ncbi:MAG: protein kinase [Phycisphaerales bacterium]
MRESVAKRAHAILKRVIAIDEPMRAAEAERLCEGDAEVLARVRQLIGALSKTDGFLDSPIGRSVRDAARAGEQPGLPSIGGFTIERLIGVGGMAAVYEAVQEMPRRRVALKVLRRSMAGTAALRRFEFETEVLAKLRHPGIAQIYEAGTFDDGAGAIPFFAMEFINGARTLTQYCDDERLELRARLELMVRVCDAVQHGHQNGVVHRDLKPGNVLVDVTGAPRVIDFGIARSTGDDAHGVNTTVGQIVGTLNAMSPEQCTPHANVDARTDVYSLGVLLYELVCGRPPHDLGSLPIPEALRVIHEVSPTRPSAIDQRLRGDLEAIILKALDKDPDRRYRTVAALGADLRRYLDYQTVEARPPTMLYQLRLLARRNRPIVAAVCVVAVALVVATIISVVAAIHANDELVQRVQAEERARDERDRALRKSYVASIAAAIAACQSGEYGKARGHLEAAPAEHRGWEWHWISGLADRSIASVNAHATRVVAMSASADGTRVASAASDGSIRVWSAPDLTEVSQARFEDGEITDCAFARDGSRVVVVTQHGSIAVLRADDGSIEEIMHAPGVQFESIDIRGSGTLALATSKGEVMLWDLGAESPASCVADQPEGVDGVSYTSDGSLLATWSRSGLVRVRDAETLETRAEWNPGTTIAAIDVRSDLDRVAIGCARGEVQIKELSTGEHVVTLAMPDHLSLVRSVAFSRDGSLIAVGQGSGSLTMVRTGNHELLGMGVGHSEAVSSLVFSHDDKRLLSSSWDGTLRLWDTQRRSSERTRPLLGHESQVTSVAFAAPSNDPTRLRLVSASTDGTVRLWDPDRDEELAVLRGHVGEVRDVAISADGSLIASCGVDRTVRLWDAVGFTELATLHGHAGTVWSVCFSPDGRTIASGGDDAVIRLWDVPSRMPAGVVDRGPRVSDLAFSHDGKRLACASRDGTARIWTLDGSDPPLILRGHEWDVFAVAWAPDDARLFSGSRDQTIRTWATATGEPLAVLEDTHQFVTSLAFSPDGERLAAGTWYGGVSVFDGRRLELIGAFRPVNELVRGVAFSPDGRLLAVASGDGAVQILDGSTAAQRSRRYMPAATRGSE